MGCLEFKLNNYGCHGKHYIATVDKGAQIEQAITEAINESMRSGFNVVFDFNATRMVAGPNSIHAELLAAYWNGSAQGSRNSTLLHRNLAARLCEEYPEAPDEIEVFDRVLDAIQGLTAEQAEICLRASDDMKRCKRLTREAARAELIEQVRCL